MLKRLQNQIFREIEKVLGTEALFYIYLHSTVNVGRGDDQLRLERHGPWCGRLW